MPSSVKMFLGNFTRISATYVIIDICGIVTHYAAISTVGYVMFDSEFFRGKDRQTIMPNLTYAETAEMRIHSLSKSLKRKQQKENEKKEGGSHSLLP